MRTKNAPRFGATLWSVCTKFWVIAQAVFLLDRGQTHRPAHKVTDATAYLPTHRLPPALVLLSRRVYSVHRGFVYVQEKLATVQDNSSTLVTKLLSIERLLTAANSTNSSHLGAVSVSALRQGPNVRWPRPTARHPLHEGLVQSRTQSVP